MITRRTLRGDRRRIDSAPTLVGRAALAQPWPASFVRFIVPFPAGVRRTSAAASSRHGSPEIWGQRAVVENKPGAGGNIGTESVACSAPDDYTVLMAAFTHAVNGFLYRSIGYDPVADFEPVTLLSHQACA